MLPKKPIKKNNPNWFEKLEDLIRRIGDRNKPRKKEERVLIMRVAISFAIPTFPSFLYNKNLTLAPHTAPTETNKISFNLYNIPNIYPPFFIK